MFSTFPNGWPGCGLLLLRLAAGAPLVVSGISLAWGTPNGPTAALLVAAGAVGALIVAGFWTPLAGAAQAAFELWLAFSGGVFDGDPALRSIIGVSLVMLGPGYWSVDAQLYGRKRIDLGP